MGSEFIPLTEVYAKVLSEEAFLFGVVPHTKITLTCVGPITVL